MSLTPSPFARLARQRILPVLTIDDPMHALPLAETFVGGGLPCIEVALRTESSLDSLRLLARCGDMLVGAGTIRTVDHAKAAVDAGAAFLVAPSCKPEVLRWCAENSVPMAPGCVTPSEIEIAADHGFHTVKFFPATSFGGAATLKAYSGPMPEVRFIPMGGIRVANLPEYLALPNVVACGGGWFASPDDLRQARYSEISKRVREAVSAVAGCMRK